MIMRKLWSELRTVLIEVKYLATQDRFKRIYLWKKKKLLIKYQKILKSFIKVLETF